MLWNIYSTFIDEGSLRLLGADSIFLPPLPILRAPWIVSFRENSRQYSGGGRDTSIQFP